MTIKTRLARIGRLSGVAVLTATLGLAACDMDEIMKVSDPDRVNEDTYQDPGLLPQVVAGAVGNFTTAYSGNGVNDSFMSVTAVMSDEFHAAGTFTTRIATDRRDQFLPADGNTSDAIYNGLHRARRALSMAAGRVAEEHGKGHKDYTRLRALEGFTYVALAEGFCSALPFTEGEAGQLQYGAPKTYDAVFRDAAAIFADAIDNATDANMEYLAAVGRGRALLNIGEYAQAAAAVADVPDDFVYYIHHSSSGATNGIYSLQNNGRYSVSEQEGTNGLPFRSAADPRVPWVEAGVGFDGVTPRYLSRRYTSISSPVALASGVEARLIEAEAALHSGGDWLGILNDLRANVAGLMEGLVPGYSSIVPDATLPPLTDPGSFDARVDLIFRERAMWLFLTGHRLGDLRRLVRDYGRAPNDVFPVGPYHKGGSYGTDVAFPLDFDEETNSEFMKAGGWDACNVKSAG